MFVIFFDDQPPSTAGPKLTTQETQAESCCDLPSHPAREAKSQVAGSWALSSPDHHTPWLLTLSGSSAPSRQQPPSPPLLRHLLNLLLQGQVPALSSVSGLRVAPYFLNLLPLSIFQGLPSLFRILQVIMAIPPASSSALTHLLHIPSASIYMATLIQG